MRGPLGLALLSFLWPSLSLAGPVEVAPPLTEGAVLQRGLPVLVSGIAAPDAGLTVRLGAEEVAVRSDGEGVWIARLGPFEAGFEPLTLTAMDSDGHAAHVPDLLVGDVFLASGQSNMAWQLQHAAADNAVLRRGSPPEGLRLYREPPRCASTPRQATGRWTGSGWDDAKRFSAIGYHFGRAYAAEEGVPVGIVLAARGGSPIDAWLPPNLLPADARRERARTLEARDRARAAFMPAMSTWLARNGKDPTGTDDPPAWPTDGALRHLPGCYWDGMLEGLSQMPIAGVLWYQGETDAYDGTPGYEGRLTTLIGAFRQAWGVGLPVIVFGLPPYEPVPETAAVRAAQDGVAAGDPKTVLVPADDLAADPLELHPRPKRGPAERAAAAMLRLREAE